MGLIRTGINITKTIRNVNRLREIVSVFAKNGFDEFIDQSVVAKIPHFVLPKSKDRIKKELAPQSRKDWGRIVGARLCKCLEELGPAFVKLGQLLATREDVFDSSFVEEMKLLRNKARGIPFSQVKKQIESSLGKTVEEVFASLEEKPIGSASIGVVHKGVLLNGSKVVVKVQRPQIARIIKTDFSIMLFLAQQAEKTSDDIKHLGLAQLIQGFLIGIQEELDFQLEARNGHRLRSNIKKHDKKNIFHIPQIYDEYTTEKIMVTELLEGISFNDEKKIKEKKLSLHKKMDEGLNVFVKTFLQDGFFHGDLHEGNFFLLAGDRIGIVDFGLMGILSRKGRQTLVSIIHSLISENYENLVYEFLDIAQYKKIPDVDVLASEFQQTLNPFMGLSLKKMHLARLIKEIIKILYRYEIHLPREWFTALRALIMLDGVGRSMDFDFDVFGKLDQNMAGIIRELVNKEDLVEESLRVGKDMLVSGRTIPRHLRWFVRQWAKRNYAFDLIHSGYEPSVNRIRGAFVFLGFSLLSCVFILSGVLLLDRGMIHDISLIPLIVWIFWTGGILLFLRGGRYLRK